MRGLAFHNAAAATGDVFFLAYLVMVWRLVFVLSPEDLDRRAEMEDEGIAVVIVITLAAIVYSSIGIFSLINEKTSADLLTAALTVAGAPLGWLTLHTLSAFHYAYIFYRGPVGKEGDALALNFPQTEEPGTWDFIYFAFVVGMTAQVSDVVVQSTPMRRAVTGHSVASFVFNTVLIAMAVNAAVAGAQTR